MTPEELYFQNEPLVRWTIKKYYPDFIDDEDQADGFIFNRFYADTSFNGIGIPWEEIL